MDSGDTEILSFDLKELMDNATKELNVNLLEAITNEGREGVLRHCIFELSEASHWFKDIPEILDGGGFSSGEGKAYNYRNKHGIQGELDLEFSATFKAFELFDWFVTQTIQLSCYKFQIDFKKLCSELDFSDNIQIHSLLMEKGEMIESLTVEIERTEQNEYVGQEDKRDIIDSLKKEIDKLKETDSKEESQYEFQFIPTKSLQIAFLNELGILNFLKEKYHIKSNRLLAKLVSEFTGIKIGTAQPAINSALEEITKARGYPLTPTNILKVKQTLTNLGIEIKED